MSYKEIGTKSELRHYIRVRAFKNLLLAVIGTAFIFMGIAGVAVASIPLLLIGVAGVGVYVLIFAHFVDMYEKEKIVKSKL